MANAFYKVCNVGQANHIGAEIEGNGCIPDRSTFTNLIIGHRMKRRMHNVGDLFNKTRVYNDCEKGI